MAVTFEWKRFWCARGENVNLFGRRLRISIKGVLRHSLDFDGSGRLLRRALK